MAEPYSAVAEAVINDLRNHVFEASNSDQPTSTLLKWQQSEAISMGNIIFQYLLGIARPLMLIALAMLSFAPAIAQDLPKSISPLQVEPDRNDVNLATGKMMQPTLILSVPGAPRLKFDKIQNAAPYIIGHLQNDLVGSGEKTAQWTVHTAEGASEGFRCAWDVDGKSCASMTGSGSALSFSGANYRRSGSGEVYTLNNVHVITIPGPGNPNLNEVRLFYASQIEYPDGEVISYTYGTATLAGDPYSRTFYRPIRVSSNTGFFITIAYQGNDLTQPSWGTPSEAAIFNASAPSTPLAKFTYNANGTVTDLAGRVYQGFTAGSLGVDIEDTNFSQTLPTEGSSALVVTPAANLPNNSKMVGTVVRDGVQWNYSYTNPTYFLGMDGYLFSGINVTGPDGYQKVYTITTGGNQTTGARNLITRVTDELGRATNYEYDQYIRVTKMIAPEGNSQSTAYDDAGNVINQTVVAKSGSGLASISQQAFVALSGFYQTNGFLDCTNTVMCWRPVWYRDGLNRQTDFVYNARGQLTEQIDPADQNGIRRKTIHEYQEVNTGAGMISRKVVTRICGVSTTCGVSDESRVEYEYWGNTSLPLLERKKSPATGETLDTRYTYDLAGRATSVDRPLAGTDDTQYFRYDILGRKTWEIGEFAPNGLHLAKRTTYRDADDKPSRVEQGTLTSSTATGLQLIEQTDVTYDSRRNAVREVLSSGGTSYKVTDSSYLAKGLQECAAVRMNPAVYSSLPTNACILGITGGSGPDRITRNIYDAAGQLLKVQKAVGTSLQQDYVTYTYTPNGKQSSVKDANGNLATLDYDGHDRLSKWTFPSKTSAGSVNPTDYESYTYDANGNRTSLRKRDGSVISFQYDALNRNTVKLVPERAGLSSTHTRDVYYGYDLRGLQTFARFDSSGGEGVTNSYDGFGRMQSSTLTMDGVTRTLTYAFDKNGNRTKVTYPDGNNFQFGYDGLNRMSVIGRNAPSGMAGFGYNSRGLRSSFASGSYTYYGYDPVGRLNALTQDMAGTAFDVTYGFGHNPASQMVTRSTSNDAYVYTGQINVNRNYTVNGLNQYMVAGPASFSYDANGNLTGDGSNIYAYDIENRLVSAGGASSAGLRYDPLGRLYETSGGASGITRFLYDGDELVAEYNAGGTLLRRYVHGSGSDDPLAWFEGSGVTDSAARLIKSNHQGSVIALTDWSGNYVGSNSYDEWGIPAPTNIGRFQYTGQAWIPELRMYHYKARIYSPTLGRFLQTDPIGYDDQVNLYAYVGNDPVNMVDPSGKYICKGSKENCGAVSAALQRGRDALASGKLSKSDSARISGVLKTYGKEGVRNGVGVTFLSKDALRAQSGGAAYARYYPSNGTSVVVLPDNFSKFGNNFVADRMATGATADQVKGFSARDERSNVVFHEGQHARDQQTLGRHLTPSEAHPSAYRTGEAINRAFGSRSTREISNAITGNDDYDY